MLRLFQHPVAILLLCFSLIGTPMTYRGGASNPHPHMFLQFLMDAEAGTFDHHHHGDVEMPENMDHHAGDHDRSSARGPSTPQQADSADRFGASLSAFVVGDVGQLAFIVPQHELAEDGLFERAFLPVDRPPAGITTPPIAPPPQ